MPTPFRTETGHAAEESQGVLRGQIKPLAERLIAARWPVTALFVLLLVASWEVVGLLGKLPVYILSPSAIIESMIINVGDGRVLPAAASSLRRQVLGFLLGTSAGVLLGLLAGVVRGIEDTFDPIVSLTQPLPKIALLPVLAVWLGFSDEARILIIAIVCFYPAFINALSGTRGIEPRFVWVAQGVGASPARAFVDVVLPAATPRLLVGVRISLALSFVMLFATEVIGSRAGLGFLIMDGFLSIRYDMMYAGLASLAFLGFGADRLLLLLGRQLTKGQTIEAAG